MHAQRTTQACYTSKAQSCMRTPLVMPVQEHACAHKTVWAVPVAATRLRMRPSPQPRHIFKAGKVQPGHCVLVVLRLASILSPWPQRLCADQDRIHSSAAARRSNPLALATYTSPLQSGGWCSYMSQTAKLSVGSSSALTSRNAGLRPPCAAQSPCVFCVGDAVHARAYLTALTVPMPGKSAWRGKQHPSAQKREHAQSCGNKACSLSRMSRHTGQWQICSASDVSHLLWPVQNLPVYCTMSW